MYTYIKNTDRKHVGACKHVFAYTTNHVLNKNSTWEKQSLNHKENNTSSLQACQEPTLLQRAQATPSSKLTPILN